MKEKLLSIIIPTYNRSKVLLYTLSLLSEQVNRNLDEVDLTICNNASTDDTDLVLKKYTSQYSSISYITYKDHVEIGESIKRSASNATGKYLLLWSDDDIPSPTLVDTILLYLKKYDGIGCLCFNRIEGYSSDITPVYNLYLTRKEFKDNIEYWEDSAQFIEEYFCDMSFMSQNVILKDCWNEGAQKDTNGYYGFEFMIPLLSGLKNRNCLYINYPLCIERHPDATNHSYGNKWPLYIFIGIPRILKSLKEWGVINDWEKCYKKFHYAQNTYAYINSLYTVFMTSFSEYRPYRNELISYQEDKARIVFTKLALSDSRLVRQFSKTFFKATKFYWLFRSYKIKYLFDKVRNLI